MPDLVIIFFTVVFLFFFFSKKMRNSANWKATVTPLASIIGSGFLVVTPLFIDILGKYALFATMGMILIAYMLGYVMRFNIQYVEPLVIKPKQKNQLYHIEKLSHLLLSFAYFISIPFYIKLLSLFLLRGLSTKGELLADCIATVLLGFIGLYGKFKGFKRLEILEEYAVNIKLSIIFAMIIGLALYNFNLAYNHHWYLLIATPVMDFDTIRKLLGTIIIIQGFETSRFLWLAYDAKTRIKTMRNAQIISGIIYIVFVGLSLVVFDSIQVISETAIIDISAKISLVLPFLLIIAAVFSQFSAAVADTISAGGLLSEVESGERKPNNNYLLIAIIAIALTWLTNTYQIIAFASRAFALYYAVQSFEATCLAIKKVTGISSFLRVLVFSSMTILMLLVTVFGISV